MSNLVAQLASFQQNHILGMYSKTPISSAGIRHNGKLIGKGFVHTPRYEHSDEAECRVWIRHFALTEKEASIKRIPETRHSIHPVVMQMMNYSIDSGTLEFLKSLDLVSGFMTKYGVQREIITKCLFYNQGILLEAFQEKKIFDLITAYTKKSYHSIHLMMDAPGQRAGDYGEFSGKLGIEFVHNSKNLGGAIYEQREVDFDLRMQQAEDLMKGKEINADNYLASMVQGANQLFAELSGRMKKYWQKMGVAIATSNLPIITYERVVSFLVDLEE